MPTVTGTPHNGGYNLAATQHTITYPGSIPEGKVLCIAYLTSETNRIPVMTGFQERGETVTVDSSFRLGVLVRATTSGEPASELMTFTPSGSTALSYISFVLDGCDVADILNSNLGYLQQDPVATTTPSITAGSLATASNSAALVLAGCEANRVISTADADIDQQIESISNTNSFAVFIDNDVGGTSNPQYDFSINSSRRLGFLVLEFKAYVPTGPSIVTVTDPVQNTIVADMDNPVEVSSIEITSGIRTEVQTNWTSEALAPDDTRFTINPVDRLTLPFLGTATLRFLDNLDALIVDTSINLTAWSGWKATLLDGLTGADIDHPESINQFRTSGTPTVDDQYMWQEITATNVQISNNDRVTFDAPGSFQLYYWDGTNETMSGPHVFEVDETGIVLVRRLRIFHNGKVLDIINSMSGL